jgi:hypothetical protein
MSKGDKIMDNELEIVGNTEVAEVAKQPTIKWETVGVVAGGALLAAGASYLLWKFAIKPAIAKAKAKKAAASPENESKTEES